MKKLITVVLILALLLPSVSLAADFDISSMTDQEIRDLISKCSAVLRLRHQSDPDGIPLFEAEGVRVCQTGDAQFQQFTGFLIIPVVIYNSTPNNVYVGIEQAHCNGWDILGGCGNVSAGSKAKADLYLTVNDADVKKLNQIESLSFAWVILNSDSYEFIYRQEFADEQRFW